MCLKPPSALGCAAVALPVAAVAPVTDAAVATTSAAVASRAPEPSSVRRRMLRTSSMTRPSASLAGPYAVMWWYDQGCRRTESLDGDALREVARLVDVVAPDGGHLAGEHLQRDRREERLEESGRLRDPDDDVGVRLHGVVPLLGDHDGPGAPGPDLLQVGHDLVVQHASPAR